MKENLEPSADKVNDKTESSSVAKEVNEDKDITSDRVDRLLGISTEGKKSTDEDEESNPSPTNSAPP